jgi:hypothetical protein
VLVYLFFPFFGVFFLFTTYGMMVHTLLVVPVPVVTPAPVPVPSMMGQTAVTNVVPGMFYSPFIFLL